VYVFPHFQATDEPTRPPHPFPSPLNLPPERFLALLIEHCLFAALNGLLYSSLTVDHHQCVHRLEGALGRTDDRLQELPLRRNALRQEKITEEIELILLNRPATAR
jgi:F-type H+-transporting ATPase subunit gamma